MSSPNPTSDSKDIFVGKIFGQVEMRQLKRLLFQCNLIWVNELLTGIYFLKVVFKILELDCIKKKTISIRK